MCILLLSQLNAHPGPQALLFHRTGEPCCHPLGCGGASAMDTQAWMTLTPGTTDLVLPRLSSQPSLQPLVSLGATLCISGFVSEGLSGLLTLGRDSGREPAASAEHGLDSCRGSASRSHQSHVSKRALQPRPSRPSPTRSRHLKHGPCPSAPRVVPKL